MSAFDTSVRAHLSEVKRKPFTPGPAPVTLRADLHSTTGDQMHLSFAPRFLLLPALVGVDRQGELRRLREQAVNLFGCDHGRPLSMFRWP